jgi:hypothetical protein
MTSPDTRPNSLSDRDIALLERMAALLRPAGSNVHVEDSRMSQLQLWALTTCGLIALGMITWSIGKIVDHGQLIVQITTQMQALEHRVTRVEERQQ